MSDEKRFRKIISANLNEVRNAIGDGLFTVRFFIVQTALGSDYALL